MLKNINITILWCSFFNRPSQIDLEAPKIGFYLLPKVQVSTRLQIALEERNTFTIRSGE